MAKIKFNQLLVSIKGKTGDMVFKTYMGRPYAARRPDFSNRVPSAKQIAHMERIRKASMYAKKALSSPEVRAAYYAVARKESKPVSGIAIGDFMNPPEIRNVDLTAYTRKAGDTIVIDAVDDFEVTGVEVTICSKAGEVLESGAAVNQNPWKYVAKTTLAGTEACTLEAAASDRPGNRTVWLGPV